MMGSFIPERSVDAHGFRIADSAGRRSFIGGSDARIIMGTDEAALLRLWREKRGEVEPEDLSGNLIVQLCLATEALNRIHAIVNGTRNITGHTDLRLCMPLSPIGGMVNDRPWLYGLDI
jgi:hypothetical protein